jgi:parallel beta-helix repeat protein
VARASCRCPGAANTDRVPRLVLKPCLPPHSERAGVSEPLESRLFLATVYVDANPAITTHDGQSWDTAYADLQPVLTAAVSGTTIKVADGTYRPTSGTDRAVSFVLKNGVGLYGGYAGSGASDPNMRDVGAYPTILSGDIGTVGSNTDNSYHVVVGSNTNSTAVLDGLTITAGNANGSTSPSDRGGGMYSESSAPTLANCIFSGNCANSGGGMWNMNSSPTLNNNTFSANTARSGGGMCNVGSSPTLTNCIFSGNTASNSGGGGMSNLSSSPTLTTCTFSDNTASYSGGGVDNWSSSSPTLVNCILGGNTAGSYGGGIANWTSSSPKLTICTLSGNSASNAGGGMYNYASSSPTLTDCTFNGNTASGSSGCGGGMLNDTSSPRLTNCALNGNTARNGGGMYNVGGSPKLTGCIFSSNTTSGGGTGGGMLNDTSSPTLTNCAFNGNTAGFAGGLYNYSASPTLTNCTFEGNTVSYRGGGMYNNASSSPTFTNCTFSGNTASGGGGGMYNDNNSSPKLNNCILWGNGITPLYNYSGTVTVTYSDIQGGYVGTGNIDADPLFVRNPNPGPDGRWGTADDDYGNLRLQPLSPAIDAGRNAAVPSGVTTDLAGGARFLDIPIRADTGVGTPPIVDMGAYEAKWLSVLYVDADAPGDENGAGWSTAYRSLSAALAAAVPSQEIRVAEGTYYPTSTTNRAATLQLKNRVKIVGGYAGYGTAFPDARSIALYPAVLSGDIGMIGYKGDNCYHVVTGSGTDSTAVLDGFTITGGCANGTSSNNSGGGMYNSSGSPTVANCIFAGSVSSGYGTGVGGGAMYNSASSPTVSNCTFIGNLAYYAAGGAVFNDSSCALLTNCRFAGNMATSGGGVYCRNSSLTLTNCTFSGNTAGRGGGGIYSASSSSLTLTNCIIWGSGSSPVYNDSSTLTVTYSDIEGVYPGTGNINADPLFVRNPSPGPDSNWGTADDDYGDLRLQAGSPCIDAGNNTAVPAGVTTDLAGLPRFWDVPGTADTGSGIAPIVDMGAYETIPPTAQPDLLAACDTGLSDSDDLTNFNNASPAKAPRFVVAGTIAGLTVSLFADGTLVASGVASGGTITLSLDGTSKLADGPHVFIARQGVPGAGSSPDSPPLTVNINTVAPALAASCDTGLSDSDGITCFDGPAARPLIFAVSGTAAGATVTMYANGVPLGSAISEGGEVTVWSDGRNPLADGTYLITARQQLPGQPQTLDSDFLALTVDTAAPAVATPDLQAASDIGVSDKDNITSDSTPTFDVAAPYYSLYRNGVLVAGPYASGPFTSGVLADGMYLFSAMAMDAAGNMAAPSPWLAVRIDTKAPTSQVALLPPASATDSFTVTWSGRDNSGGTGIASYDIYVSDNGATPALWQDHTTATSATYTGQFGHNYAFFSAARDIAGNVESLAATPDTQTTILSTWNGSAGDDQFSLRVDPTGSLVEFYTTALSPGAIPAFVVPLSIMQPFTISGQGGNDTLTFDFTYGNPIPPGSLTLDAAGGTFTLNILGSPGNDNITLTGTQLTCNSAILPLAAVQSVALNTSAGDDTVNLDGSFTLPYTLQFGAGADTLNIQGGTRAFPADLGSGADVALNLSASAKVTFSATQHLRSLGIGPNTSTAFFPGLPAALFAKGLTIGGTGVSLGKLDLADSDLVLGYSGLSPYESVRPWFLAGMVAGRGIFSSTGSVSSPTVLGVADNAMIRQTTWNGHTVSDGVNFKQLLTKRTLFGDANLDGRVDEHDELTILTNMGRVGATYFEGDVNYGGAVTLDDLAIVQANLGAGTALAGSNLLVAPVKPAAPVNSAAAVPAAARPTPAASAKSVANKVVKLAKTKVQKPKVVKKARRS